MMKTIWKYELKPQDRQKISVPLESKILSVKEQNEQIVAYFLVDDKQNTITESLEFAIVGTGNNAGEDIGDFTFLGTIKMYNGSLMFHVFYKS